jgi:hypothetical protein
MAYYFLTKAKILRTPRCIGPLIQPPSERMSVCKTPLIPGGDGPRGATPPQKHPAVGKLMVSHIGDALTASSMFRDNVSRDHFRLDNARAGTRGTIIGSGKTCAGWDRSSMMRSCGVDMCGVGMMHFNVWYFNYALQLLSHVDLSLFVFF